MSIDEQELQQKIEIPFNDHIMRAYFYPREFSPEECQRILAIQSDLALTQYWEAQSEAYLAAESCGPKLTRKLIAYSPENQWLFERLAQIIYGFNDRCFQFEVTNLVGTQIVELHPGDEYPWHVDLGDELFSLRKLSFVLFLSDEQSYQGGNYLLGSGTHNKEEQNQGTFGLHPAYFMTRITPVERGCLRLLMTWAHGQNPLA